MRKNNDSGRLTVYLISAVIFAGAVILLIVNSINGSDVSSAQINSNTSSTGNSFSGENKTPSPPEIKTAMSDDGITPRVPACVVKGAESYYSDSLIIDNPDDFLCIVNRKYNLSSDYCPEDLVTVSIPFAPGRTDDVKQMRSEASAALSELYNAAEKEGFKLYGASGFRSYNTQMVLFNKSVASKGSIEEAGKLNALPGQSEHQLGLAMDFTLEELGYRLKESFGETEEGIWLRENCHKFGFIIRYPKGKEDITGYSYEPWHCRYVGKKAAEYIYENSLTLEEFYGLK
ncbi:MAG: M15 family metallopeptidase [Bacillota bacterium]|nr:M15 family metallopeptidase [Bacillota bacterium]